MADLSRIPIRYFEQTDPYGYVVDNRPLQDLARRIDLVNQEVTGISSQLQTAGGTQGLVERLNRSLNPDGTLKGSSVPPHNLDIHPDAGGYVKMTAEERSKLQGIAPSATSFGIKVNQNPVLQSGCAHLLDSQTIKLVQTGSQIRLYSLVPSGYYHRHYGPSEPLVKCRKEGSQYIWDEEASPAYFVRAISTYQINRDRGNYPLYFYTNDGIPVGESEGTPVPFRVGSLGCQVNGVGLPIDYSDSDALLGRFRISSETGYYPKYLSVTDYDRFTAVWEKGFQPETEGLGPQVAPKMGFEAFSVGTTLPIRTTNPTAITAFLLDSPPAAVEADWDRPPTYVSGISYLKFPPGLVFDNGKAQPWCTSTDPQSGSGGWSILRKDNGLNFDYYLGWLESTPPTYPIYLFYYRRD